MSLDPNKTYLQWNGTTFPNASAAQFKAPAGSSIDWGDGVVETFDTASTTVNTHTYTDGKTEHTIAISGLTSIERSAFSGCRGLTSVTIGNSVTSIGNFAFQSCSGLTSVTIGNGVTSIGSSAFAYCNKLVEVINQSALPITKGSNDYGYVAYYALTVKQSGTTDIVNQDGYLFYTYEGTNYLLGYSGNETDLVLPDTYNGESYQIYKYAFHNCSGLTSVTIPDSVTSIGDSAFYGCSGLTSVTIGNSVTSIGSNAFYNCSNLTSVTIGNGVTSIGSNAFYNCSNLTSVTIPDSVTSIGERAFKGCSELTSVTIPDSVTSIGLEAFNDTAYYNNASNWQDDVLYIGKHLITAKSTLSGDCVIKNGTLTIANNAFYKCIYLTSITIPDSVTSIGRSAFATCSALISVVIPDSVTSIGDFVFSDCKKLTSVTIPYNVTSIGSNAFYNCSGLTSFTIPDSVTSIGNAAFYGCSGLTSVTIGNGVTSIGYSAFSNCSGLTSFTIPDSVTSIGNFAFRYCSGLTSVTIGNSVTSIGSSAFEYCNKLVEVINQSALPITKGSNDYGYVAYYALTVKQSGTTDIVHQGDYLFYTYEGTNYLLGYSGNETDLVLPDTYDGNSYQIYKYAFEYCSGLTSVTIGNSVTSIGERAFKGCSELTSVTIPDSVTSIGLEAFNDTAYYNNASNWQDDVLYIGKHLITAKSTLSGDCVIKNGTLTIANNAFQSCSGLTSITISNGVTSIGGYAFYSCSGLTSVTIGNSVTSIGSNAFYGCSGLTGAYINDLSAWCKIEFRDSYSNPLYYAKNLYLNNELVTDLVIPDSVTSINNYAFYNCSSIANVTIPDSVMSIGKSAFYNTAYYNNESNWHDDVLYIGKHLITAKSTFSGDCVIKNSTLIIADYAFYNCSSLANVTIPDSVTSIGDCAFYKCSGLTSITLPFVGAKKDATNITYFGYIFGAPSSSDNSSYVPSSLKTVIITGGTSIGNAAFYGCSGLTSVTIGNGVTSIGSSAFYGCSGLTSFTIPDSVTSIGNAAFYGCSGLTSVTIGNGVTSIGNDAFEGCSSLKQLILFPSTPPTLGTSAIPTTISNIYAQQSSKAAYQAATNWIAFASKIVSDNLYLSFARFNQKNKEYINTAIVNAITKSLNTAV